MKHSYTVFSAHQQPAQVEATLADGRKVQALVTVLEVQLVPADHHPGAGTTKLTFKGEEIAEAVTVFVPGTTVEATYESLYLTIQALTAASTPAPEAAAQGE